MEKGLYSEALKSLFPFVPLSGSDIGTLPVHRILKFDPYLGYQVFCFVLGLFLNHCNDTFQRGLQGLHPQIQQTLHPVRPTVLIWGMEIVAK